MTTRADSVGETTAAWGAAMITSFADPFDALLSLQRELEARYASDWLHDQTASRGPFPPINVFQQGDDILAIMELPGVDKNDLQIQAKANTVRISGKKNVSYSDGASRMASSPWCCSRWRRPSPPTISVVRTRLGVRSWPKRPRGPSMCKCC
jgi:hypothetical protein